MSNSKRMPRCFHFVTVSSSLGILAGLSIFFSFLIVYRNYNAALWGLASALFATVVLHLQILYLRNSLFKMYGIKSFDFMRTAGAITGLACVIACIMYITLSALYDKGYQIDGYAPAAVFSMITCKWPGTLIVQSNQFKKIMFQDSEVKNLFTAGVTEEHRHGMSTSYSTDLEKAECNDK